MKTFKLSNYIDLERGINAIINDLNAVAVGKALAPYIDATSLDKLNAADILQRQKQDKADSLPGAADFRRAGVDLSLTVPECPVSAPQLQAIADVVTQYQKSIYAYQTPFISYSQKAGKFVMNAAGAAALDAAVIRLDGADETTLDMVTSLANHLHKRNPALLWKLLPTRFRHGTLDMVHGDKFRDQLNISDLVEFLNKNKAN